MVVRTETEGAIAVDVRAVFHLLKASTNALYWTNVVLHRRITFQASDYENIYEVLSENYCSNTNTSLVNIVVLKQICKYI